MGRVVCDPAGSFRPGDAALAEYPLGMQAQADFAMWHPWIPSEK
jgi:hypothetical protein